VSRALRGWSSPEAWALAALALGAEPDLVEVAQDASDAWEGDDPAAFLEALQEALVPHLLALWADSSPVLLSSSAAHEVARWFAQTRTMAVTRADLAALSAACWAEGEE
jgi:predicted lipid-binding transport protein (Tim44 family)